MNEFHSPELWKTSYLMRKLNEFLQLSNLIWKVYNRHTASLCKVQNLSKQLWDKDTLFAHFGFVCVWVLFGVHLLRWGIKRRPSTCCDHAPKDLWGHHKRNLAIVVDAHWRCLAGSTGLKQLAQSLQLQHQTTWLESVQEIPILISITWDKVCECCEKISWEYPWTCIEVSVCILVLRRGNKEFKQISDTQYTFVILLCCGSEQFYFSIE